MAEAYQGQWFKVPLDIAEDIAGHQPQSRVGL
jgi:hypothetical protein